MTPLIISGLLLSLIGSALGIVGAWYTASKITRERHFGFACWLINSPMIMISLIGVGCELWEPLAAICFVPMHTIYWFTAWRGFLNTQVREYKGCFYGCPYCSDESMQEITGKDGSPLLQVCELSDEEIEKRAREIFAKGSKQLSPPISKREISADCGVLIKIFTDPKR